ncbi:hypothetical protein ACFY8P_13090 [Streptomyces sp. NPDC012693]|jgi:2-phosphosulfolactate phosphatase|uniref:hypothetical protein n=1 Tax=unclassified Streptomyces TaxID=2593676 RepID=UPI00202F1C6B|nr:hypothetical protein [Streptomyces sp. MSC1_001]
MAVAFGRGPVAARALAPSAACAVVVDVLSSTTALADARERGAVPAGLADPHPLTPEATAAATPWSATEDPVTALHGCDSGRELYEYGFPRDVAVAAEADSSTAVPVLVDGAFQEAP